MEVLYGYEPYPSPKIGIFKIPGNVYRGGYGWVDPEKERTIIGETDDTYVYELRQCTGGGEWTDKGQSEFYPIILPLGLHKSRLVKWVDKPIIIQLNLF